MSRVAVTMVLLLCLGASGGASAAPARDLQAFAFQPHSGAALPLSAALVDESGKPVTLGQFFNGKPVVLVLEYLRCKSLCGLTLENIIAALDALPLDAGRDFAVLAVSIDPRDTPADLGRAKSRYLSAYHHRGADAGFHFLAGGGSGSARRIAEAVGFPYRYDSDTGQYIHPAGFVIASPDGLIARYIFGVGVEAPALRAAVAGAARGEATGPLDRLFLLCHVEGAPLGRYTVPVMAALMLGNIGAGLAAVAIFAAIRRRRWG